MSKLAISFAAAALLASVGFARDIVALSNGWTADGAPVTIPHTWNALDASDGKDIKPDAVREWYSAGSPSPSAVTALAAPTRVQTTGRVALVATLRIRATTQAK